MAGGVNIRQLVGRILVETEAAHIVTDAQVEQIEVIAALDLGAQNLFVFDKAASKDHLDVRHRTQQHSKVSISHGEIEIHYRGYVDLTKSKDSLSVKLVLTPIKNKARLTDNAISKQAAYTKSGVSLYDAPFLNYQINERAGIKANFENLKTDGEYSLKDRALVEDRGWVVLGDYVDDGYVDDGYVGSVERFYNGAHREKPKVMATGSVVVNNYIELDYMNLDYAGDAEIF